MHITKKFLHFLSQQILKNRWVLRLIGIGVFVLILTRIDWAAFLATIKSVDPFWIAGSLLLQAVALLVTTWRWQLIMKYLEIRVSYRRSLTHQLIGTGMAMITPGQLGEFIKVVYHRGMGYPIPESALSIIIDRFYDFGMLCVFGLISVPFLFGVQITHVIIIAVVAIFILLMSVVYLRDKENNAHRLAFVLTRVGPKQYKEMIQQNIERLVRKVTSIELKLFLVCILLSFVNYSLLLLKVYMLALSVHMQVDFWYFASAVPLFRLIGLVPISISGIGTRDALIIYMLSRVGVPPESSLMLSLLSLATLQLQALIGVLFWWRFPPISVKDIDSHSEAVLKYQ